MIPVAYGKLTLHRPAMKLQSFEHFRWRYREFSVVFEASLADARQGAASFEAVAAGLKD